MLIVCILLLTSCGITEKQESSANSENTIKIAIIDVDLSNKFKSLKSVDEFFKFIDAAEEESKGIDEYGTEVSDVKCNIIAVTAFPTGIAIHGYEYVALAEYEYP